jgi:hypothetical protein
MKRVIDLEAGTAMIVTDLHGDWDAYRRYRDRFLQLQANGRADYFILTGDLIHHEGAVEEDQSLAMVLDVFALQQELGDRLIYLLGNHEMPHIYSITLAKGDHLYTPRFEAAMGQHRAAIMALFDNLPFYVRTRAGVTICHAGAAAELSDAQAIETLFHFSHQQLLREAEAMIEEGKRPSLRRAITKMSQQSYDDIVRDYFAITSPNDPRYDNYLIGVLASSFQAKFDLLWQALFTINEHEYGEQSYMAVVQTMLEAFGRDYYPQRVLVSGHLNCRGGYTVVNKHQFRLASCKHAQPREAGLYLLLDVAKEVKGAEALLDGRYSVFA